MKSAILAAMLTLAPMLAPAGTTFSDYYAEMYNDMGHAVITFMTSSRFAKLNNEVGGYFTMVEIPTEGNVVVLTADGQAKIEQFATLVEKFLESK